MSRKRSGSQRPAQNPKFPEDCVQSLAEDWWTVAEDPEVRRGQLLWAHIPFVGWLPHELVPEARSSPTDHRRVLFRLQQQRSSQRPTSSELPVAALPQYPGEAYSVYRAKLRPVLVIGTGGVEIDGALTRGAAKWQSARTYLVAPYFGAERSGQRGGWKPEFVRRIRRCEYPQYLWNQLPIGGESILRLDQIQPIGRHHEAFEYTPHRLSSDAIEILDEWLRWCLFDQLDSDGMLTMARQEFEDLTEG